MTDWLSKHRLADAVLDALTASICVVDENGTIVATNEAWRRFARQNGGSGSYLGVNYAEVCFRAASSGQSPARRFGQAVRDVLTGSRDHFEAEYPCHAPDERRWFLGRVTPLVLDTGEDGTARVGAVISHQDITERKLLELKLRRLAETDELTGLKNRWKFMELADKTLILVRRGEMKASLILLDLDHFKSINDTHGHAAGDEALRVTARQLKRVARRHDHVARIGGEEFAIILSQTDEWGAIMMAERIRTAMHSCTIAAGKSRFSLTASLGVSEFDIADSDAGETLARADKSLYRAKDEGRNCVRASSLATVTPQVA